MDVAISFCGDYRDALKYNGLFSLPGDHHWRSVKNAHGEISQFDTSEAAEAKAGHVLVHYLRLIPC